MRPSLSQDLCPLLQLLPVLINWQLQVVESHQRSKLFVLIPWWGTKVNGGWCGYQAAPCFWAFSSPSSVLESWVVLCIIRNVVYNRQCLFRSLAIEIMQWYKNNPFLLPYLCNFNISKISISFSLLQKKIPTHCSLWQLFVLGWLNCLSQWIHFFFLSRGGSLHVRSLVLFSGSISYLLLNLCGLGSLGSVSFPSEYVCSYVYDVILIITRYFLFALMFITRLFL